MVGYMLDNEDRILVTMRGTTAKWHNVVRQPKVSIAVADGRSHVVVYGPAELIETDPLRGELAADLFAAIMGGDRRIHRR